MSTYLIWISCGAGILKCRPRVLPVDGDHESGALKEHPKRVIPKSKFFGQSIGFKCQHTPELFTLNFGQKVVPEY